MGEIGFLFQEILVRPIINILVLIYQGLIVVDIPSALGFAVILLTVVIRFILYPLTHSQLKASHKMQQLSPHLSKLKEKHKGDSTRIQQETMKLYKEHGVNPAAGCLPVLIQLPIIWALYSVLQRIVSLKPDMVVSYVNKLIYPGLPHLAAPWNQDFFSIPLGQNPSQLISSMPLIILVPVITGALQFLQSKMMYVKPQVSVSASKEKKKEDDFSSVFQTQSMYIFPLMIGFFSYSFPIGLSLYWNTFTLFGILQQQRIQGGVISKTPQQKTTWMPKNKK